MGGGEERKGEGARCGRARGKRRSWWSRGESDLKRGRPDGDGRSLGASGLRLNSHLFACQNSLGRAITFLCLQHGHLWAGSARTTNPQSQQNSLGRPRSADAWTTQVLIALNKPFPGYLALLCPRPALLRYPDYHPSSLEPLATEHRNNPTQPRHRYSPGRIGGG
jgi:hypothetical protein